MTEKFSRPKINQSPLNKRELDEMKRKIRENALILHEKATGRRIFSRLNELNNTQWLSRNELDNLQQEKLQQIVEYAYNNVPYYHRIFDRAGFHPDDLRKDLANFSKIPILTKAIIRENSSDFLTSEISHRRNLSQLYTSGSTGNPLLFYQDPIFRDYVTADIQRHMGWAGWQLGDSQAIIWGAKKATLNNKIRTKLIDKVWNRIQMNAFFMNEEQMTNFAKRIIKQKPTVLFGYATCLDQFSHFVREKVRTKISFGGIFSTAEVLTLSTRIYIEETFQCKVFDRYGTLELGGIGCECNFHDGLHLSVENNYVEILDNGVPLEPNHIGEIIVTNLNNYGMPFIRYSVGDFGSWKEDAECDCGRQSIRINSVSGRLAERFITRDGRRVRAAFSGGFKCFSHSSIKQFQVIQKTLDWVIVRLAISEELPPIVLGEIEKTIQTTFGQHIKVDFEFLDKITPLPSGKHQYVISEVNQQ